MQQAAELRTKCCVLCWSADGAPSFQPHVWTHLDLVSRKVERFKKRKKKHNIHKYTYMMDTNQVHDYIFRLRHLKGKLLFTFPLLLPFRLFQLLFFFPFFWQLFWDLSCDLFSPQISEHWSQRVKNKPRSPHFLPPCPSRPPPREFVIPCWVQQTCVYQFTVAGQGGLSVCRPALCLSHCETQQQLDFSLTAC